MKRLRDSLRSVGAGESGRAWIAASTLLGGGVRTQNQDRDYAYLSNSSWVMFDNEV